MVGSGLGLTPEALDQLKVWLRSCLLNAYGWGSDCESLMRYVVALVKKDRTIEQLRNDCLEQLKAFFNDNTAKFVSELFECLEDKAYLEPYGTIKGGGDRSKKDGDDQADKSAGAEGLAFIVDKKPDPMIVSMANTKDKEREDGPSGLNRTRSRSKEKERSRSPHLVGTRRRSRSPPRRSRSPPPSPLASLRRFRSRSRSRSRERYRGGRKGRSRSPPSGRHRGGRVPPSKHSRSRSRSPTSGLLPLRDLRDTLTRKHQNNGSSIVPVVTGPAPHLAGRRERCRDFDEQGFCIQGELCPFDHGADPVILDSAAHPPYNPTLRGGNGVPILPVVPEYNPLEPDMRHPQARPPPHVHDSGHPHDIHPSGPHHRLGPGGPYGSAGGLGSGWKYPPGPPTIPGGGSHGGPVLQRELVTIPRNNLTQIQRAVVAPPNENNAGIARGGTGPQGRFQRGTELEVRKIPRQQNNIATLNEFFSKFGTITNIQVNFQGCPESALVSFSTHYEANAAFRSTDAVLGNRFIRLFWHNSAGGNMNTGVRALTGGNQNLHGNNQNNNNNHSSSGGAQINKRLQAMQGGHEEAGMQPKKSKPNPEALRKDNQADKSAQLNSQRSRLIDKYMEDKKLLLDRYEKCTSETEKEQIKNMIAHMTSIIEEVRLKAAPSAPLPEITNEKQLLDAELDLYRQMQASRQGQNSAEARQLEIQLAALRRHAKTLGLLDVANVWHGRLPHKGLLVGQTGAAVKGAAAKAQPGQLALDKRPRVIAVMAGQLEMAGLCKHFSRFGKVANVAEEGQDDAKHFLFTFATRKDAEFAINRGGVFRGIPLKWHWKEQQPQQQGQTQQPPPHDEQKKSQTATEQHNKTTTSLAKELSPLDSQQQGSNDSRNDTAVAAAARGGVADDSTKPEAAGSAQPATKPTSQNLTEKHQEQQQRQHQPQSSVQGDEDHLFGYDDDDDHVAEGKRVDGNCGRDADAAAGGDVKDDSGLLEDEDDDEAAGEARSWRH